MARKKKRTLTPTRTRIRKEDLVLVIAGKSRDLSKPRRVLQVMPGEGRVLVEGANMVKRHTKPNPQRNVTGGILEKEAPIHVSNVALIDPASKRPTRLRRRLADDGTRVRVAARSGEVLDK